MPLVGEIAASLAGALRLVLRDAQGVRLFNLSVEGFWRSFLAAAIVLPFALLLDQVPLPGEVADGTAESAGPGLLILRYAAEWVVRPLILLGLSLLLGRGARFAQTVIAWNWVAVPEFAIFAAAVLLMALLPPLAFLLLVTALGAMFAIDYFVTRTTLDVGPAPAFAVVVAVFLAQLVIGLATLPG